MERQEFDLFIYLFYFILFYFSWLHCGNWAEVSHIGVLSSFKNMNLCEIARRNVHHRHTSWPTQEKATFQRQYFGQRHRELAHVKVLPTVICASYFFWHKQLSTWCSNFSTDKTHLCSGRNFCRQIAQPTLLVNMGRKACRRKTGKPTPVSAPEVGEGGCSFFQAYWQQEHSGVFLEQGMFQIWVLSVLFQTVVDMKK